MAEYISKEAVIKHLDKCRTDPLFDPDMARICFAISVFIENMQAADVHPVKRGEWKHIAGMNSKCSVCSHYFPVIEFDSRPFDINFCPNCGADMREPETIKG